jgi:hypothetical protein
MGDVPFWRTGLNDRLYLVIIDRERRAERLSFTANTLKRIDQYGSVCLKGNRSIYLIVVHIDIELTG